MLEVEKQGGFQAGDVEVSEHLCDVAFVEGGDDFGVHDDGVGDDQIGNEGADVLAVVVDLEVLLAFAGETLFLELDDEGSLVKFFVETGLERVQNGVGGSDDFFGDFGIVGHFGEVVF